MKKAYFIKGKDHCGKDCLYLQGGFTTGIELIYRSVAMKRKYANDTALVRAMNGVKHRDSTVAIVELEY